jgi:hypothetical protein
MTSSRALASPISVASAPSADPAFTFARRITAADYNGAGMALPRPSPMSAAPRAQATSQPVEGSSLAKRGQATLSAAEIKCEYVQV